MRITEEETRRIAVLAHLELSDGEVTRMSGELTRILEYIDQLNEVDISGVSATADHASTPLAADEIGPSLEGDGVAANAPSFIHGHFVVPKIIGGEA
jgi:aspartyl-tRNA(Asn)/glutamyl-tRNA(Gln) amidotransferase subunit C